MQQTIRPKDQAHEGSVGTEMPPISTGLQQETQATMNRPTSSIIHHPNDRVKVVVKGIKGTDLGERVKLSIKGTTVLKLSEICSTEANDEIIVDCLERKIRNLLQSVKQDWNAMEQGQEKQKEKMKMNLQPMGGGDPVVEEFETTDPSRVMERSKKGAVEESESSPDDPADESKSPEAMMTPSGSAQAQKPMINVASEQMKQGMQF
jgi:hypothetical protein